MTDDLSNRLVEAIAWWRIRLPDARAVLEDAATHLLSAGDDRPSIVELASLYTDSDPLEVERVIERVVVELDLQVALSYDPATIATRRLCRLVISGQLTARELARWAHQRFHHESESELVNDLALLDDEYDTLEWSGRPMMVLDAQVRETARRIVELR